MKLLHRFRALFHRDQVDAEMSEEIRTHLELEAAENERRGMSARDARFAAQRAFGGVEQIKERVRDQRRWIWLEQLAQDIRFGARGLRQSPGFTLVVAATLALGVGINTSMFTAVQAILLRDLPLPDSGRVVQVFRTSPQSQRWPHSPANFIEEQTGNNVFAAMAAVDGDSFNLAEPGQPAERVIGRRLSADIFSVLGVRPLLGRPFTADEDRPGNAVAVLGYRFWQIRFGGNPAIVGRTLRLDGEAVEVIGVLPPEVHEIPLVGRVDVWRPIGFTSEQRANRGGSYLQSLGRLKPGVTLTQAQAALDAIAARQAREHPENNAGMGLRLVPLADAIEPHAKLGIWLTMALAMLVLLIACANLANLHFARTARRIPELAVRGALGATRWRLLRQLLAESLLLAALGGGLGLLLATWANGVLAAQLFTNGELTLPLNLRVLGFALGASSIAGLAFGLAPAWLASRADPNAAIKQSGRDAGGDRSRHRVQHVLIVSEVALAVVLLAAAGLVVRGLQRFAARPAGWGVDGLVVGSLSLPEAKYHSERARRGFAERLHEKLAAVPGVTEAALAWSLPLRPFVATASFAIAGRPEPPPGQEPRRHLNSVTPGYFATLRMRLVLGRDFTDRDTAGAPPVVIINETMARTFWPGKSPLGERVGDEEIIGVVNDVRFPTEPGAPGTPFQTYRPLAQAPPEKVSVALRGSVTAESLRQAVAELDPDLPLNDIRPARAAVEQSLARLDVMGWLLSGFGALGLLLASLGIYGVIAGFAVQRTREIGIRMTLGAQVRDVLWLVVGKALRLSLVGVALGVAGALGVARATAVLIAEAGPSDPLAIVLAAGLLLVVAVLACWLPARRATRVNPMVALRAE